MKALIQIVFCCLLCTQLQAQKYYANTPRSNLEWKNFNPNYQSSAAMLMQDKLFLNLRDKDKLTLFSTYDDPSGFVHYRLQQTYEGIPVVGATYLIHEKNGKVKRSNGKLVRGLDVLVNPAISEAVALQKAMQHTDATLYAWEAPVSQKIKQHINACQDATFYPTGELVIIDPHFGHLPANYRLAYKFDIFSLQPHNRVWVYVDAHTGKILHTIQRMHCCTDTNSTGSTLYSGDVEFTACTESGTYTLSNDIGGGMYVFNANGTDSLPELTFTDADGFFEADPAANEVHWAAQKTYEYFRNIHNRNSLDNNEMPIFSWVHALIADSPNNAAWNGYYVSYGDGDGIKYNPLTSPDVVGHEMTHGIIDHSADLYYFNESGALNESFADIFGEIIERYSRGQNDWIIGADFTVQSGKNGIRNMSNPKAADMIHQQPDTYAGEYWYTGPLGYADGVHINSGVQNHWFYLLSEGGNGLNDHEIGYNISGIGMEKAAQIVYRNLNIYLTETSTYADARIGAIQAAEDLFGEASEEAIQTEAAWDAVGIAAYTPPDCHTSDSLALVALYEATGGNIGWDLSQPMNTWSGILTNISGCVSFISLPETNLVGTIPPEIGEISELQFLYLNGNQLGGNIPAEIGNLTNLEVLDVHDNDLVGQIPAEIADMTNLRELFLYDNALTGRIPPELGNLTNLQILDVNTNALIDTIPLALSNLANLRELILYSNGLTGEIPPELSNLSNLERLHLSTNDLEGEIPVELGNLTNLYELKLHRNELTGNIPSELGNLVNLEELLLFYNNLTGGIPLALTNLTKLREVVLHGNDLSGSIPAELGNLINLTLLQLDNNNLSGSIPPEFGNLTELQYLYLHENELTGAIPSQFGNLTKLIELDLSANDLSDSIPVEFGNLTELQYLYLHENELTGAIPSQFGNLTKLVELNLSANNLSESISPEFGNLIELQYLYLHANELTGAIPVDLSNLTDLRELILYDNKLTGTIPIEFGNFSELRYFYLQDNLLEGTIPSELGSLSQLLYFRLDRNQLSGDIPIELSNLSNLVHLQLYDNELTGSIPPELGSLTNLTILSLHTNQLSNTIPVELSVLDKLNYLYLHSNELTGNIPPELGSLSNLLHLYLSSNQLTGTIPIELSSLSNLTRLRLGDNQLEGIIPIELSYLSNLEELHIHSNQLTGSIPPELADLSELLVLYSYKNLLTGTIPPELGDLSQLKYLSLYGNQLTGSIPNELGNLNDLERLFLSTNQLSGTIPAELGDLTKLEQLILYTNQLTGNIPPELGDLSQLNHLSLYDNQLTGSIPTELGNLNDLERLFLSTNQLSGTIPAELGDLTKLEQLSLYANQLTGNIPSELGNLSNLTILQLDRNLLSGDIPAELGNLTNLTILRLYQNQLSGTIPPELGDMTSLEQLLLSDNQLSGFIPLELGQLNELWWLSLKSNNLVGNIPASIGNLPNLTILYTYNNQLSGCYPDALMTLCSQLDSTYNSNAYISNDNNFNTTWEEFCAFGSDACQDRDVYPGDFDGDGVVSGADLLHWGIVEGNSGIPRPNASLEWSPQPCPEWQSYFNDINLKHADGNGSGFIDTDDIQAFINNYGASNANLSYAFTDSPLFYSLGVIDISEDNDKITLVFDLFIESETGAPVIAHGLACSINWGSFSVDSLYFDFSNSALQPHEDFYIFNENTNTVDIALTRTDKINQICDQPIARGIVVMDDLQVVDGEPIQITGGTAMSAEGTLSDILGITQYNIMAMEGIDGNTVTLYATFGECNHPGEASINVSGSAAPYTYAWSNGSTGTSVDNLYIGTHSVTLTDADNNVRILDFEVEWAFTPVEVRVEGTQVCFDFENAPLNEPVQVSLDNNMTFQSPIIDNECYELTDSIQHLWIQRESDECPVDLGEVTSNITTSTASPLSNEFDIQLVNTAEREPYLMYHLNHPADVNIDLYTIHGQHITTFNAEETAGTHRIPIAKKKLPAGIYCLLVEIQLSNGFLIQQLLKVPVLN